MKKTKCVFVLAFVFILLNGSGALAGDYHNQAGRQDLSLTTPTIRCAQCHVMHGTQGGGATTNLIYDGSPVTPYAALLMSSTILDLCNYCHNGVTGWSAPQVFSPSYNAAAGDYSSADEWTRHDVNTGDSDTTTMPPGYNDTQGAWDTFRTDYYDGSGLSCVFCHDQHGNANYRNLKPYPLTPLTRDPDVTTGVKVTYEESFSANEPGIVNTPLTNPARFDTSNVVYRRHEYSGNVVQISRFCGACHENFYDAPGGANVEGSTSGHNSTNNQWIRHPVGGITIAQGETNLHVDHDTSSVNLGGASSDLRVIDLDGTVNTGDEQPFCLTCHRAHGSSRHSSLIFGSMGVETDGGGSEDQMTDTCQKCHNQ